MYYYVSKRKGKYFYTFNHFYSNLQKEQKSTNLLRTHTIYIRNYMGQKCEGNCGLCVLNEILKKIYPENLKKIVGAVWKLPAK